MMRTMLVKILFVVAMGRLGRNLHRRYCFRRLHPRPLLLVSFVMIPFRILIVRLCR